MNSIIPRRLGMLTLGLVASSFYLGVTHSQADDYILESRTPVLESPGGLHLSPGQQQSIDLFGWPHAFTLWRDDAGKRYEAWTWFDSGMTYFFVDREFTQWEPAAVLSLDAESTLWRPTQFRLGTDEKILREELKSHRWESLGLFELIDGAKGIAADGVVLSFDAKGLRVVETWTEGH